MNLEKLAGKYTRDRGDSKSAVIQHGHESRAGNKQFAEAGGRSEHKFSRQF